MKRSLFTVLDLRDGGKVVTARRGRVEGKIAIVTGAGSTPGPGVATGRATAIVLAREGARVLLADIRPDRAEETQSIIASEGGTALKHLHAQVCVAREKSPIGSVEFTTRGWGLPLWESQGADLPLTLPLQEERSWAQPATRWSEEQGSHHL